MRRYELGEVLVAGRDDDVDIRILRLPGQRANHVVGFDVVDPQDRETERTDYREHRFDLDLQVIRSRCAIALYSAYIASRNVDREHR